MIVGSVKVVKVTALIVFMFTLVSCGGGGGGIDTSGHPSTGAGLSSSGNSSSTVANTPAAGVSSAITEAGSPNIFNGTGAATLNWDSPTTYTDGSALVNLAGHNVYVYNESGYVKIKSITNPSVSEYLVESLSVGTYTFVITAFDGDGAESAFSNSKTFTIS